MKSIQVDKNGGGYFGLFNPEISTKGSLKCVRGMDGEFLDEMGITFEPGDTTTIHVPFKDQPSVGHKLYYVRIYEATPELYKAEFIDRDEV